MILSNELQLDCVIQIAHLVSLILGDVSAIQESLELLIDVLGLYLQLRNLNRGARYGRFRTGMTKTAEELVAACLVGQHGHWPGSTALRLGR